MTNSILLTLAIDPHMEVWGMGPELWAERTKAWVEGIALVLDILVAKIGVLGLAVIAVWQNLKASRLKAELNERLDRQGERLDQVALAVPPAITSTVKIEQPPDEPIPVTETEIPSI